ncbi:MAG: hypothetical protein JWM98_1639 [Thermoleophilia bacterium]|nr:hypothetical protein [Thermoleophilia bacterium]
MADGFGIQGSTPGVNSALPGAPSTSQAADAAANLPSAPTTDVQAPSTQAPTSYTADPAIAPQVNSKVVARLLQQNATLYGPGLARVPLPARPDGTPRTAPKKPAGPMVGPRSLDGGKSPLASTSLFDARASIDALGELPDTGHDVGAYWSGRLDALEHFLGDGA